MARPKDKALLSEAFEQRCQREKEKLKVNLGKVLQEDILRLLTEELHMDTSVTDGHQTAAAHRFILSARASSLFNGVKEKINEDSMTTFTIPHNNIFHLKDFIKQLYYTENVDSLLDEYSQGFVKRQNGDKICDAMLNNLDDLNHNSSDLTKDNRDRSSCSYETNTGNYESNNGEVTLSDVKVQMKQVDSVVEKRNEDDSHEQICENDLNEKENVTPSESGSTDNNTLSNLIKMSYNLALPHVCCSCLGQDLLRAFLQEKCTDCSLIVAGQQFKTHRCILAARSEYFEAMLGGQWRESDRNDIELEGVSPGAVEQALLYLYGGVTDIIETCNIPDLLLVGDMYGMIGLKEVASYQIKKDFCHFFHKPCSACLSSAGDALTLAVTYDLHDMKERCVKWINKYFTKFWSSRTFAAQHEEILHICCNNLISQISEQNVVDIIMDTHKLSGNLPSVKWAEPILYLISQLNHATKSFISQNFVSVMSSKQFLCWEKGAAWNASVLEDIFGSVIETVSPSNGCKIYQKLLDLEKYFALIEYSINNEDIAAFIKYLIKKCETFLRINIHQVTLTEDWSNLSEDIRTKILSCASYVCIDYNKMKKAPPKLNTNRKIKVASTQKIKKSSTVKPLTRQLSENPQTATKSDTLLTRQTSTPSARPPSRGRPVEKAATKTTKNPKCETSSMQPQRDVKTNIKTKKQSEQKQEDGATSDLHQRTHEVQYLGASSIPKRQLSWSPDPEGSISPISVSPRSDSRIPIHRTSSLSPRGKIDSRSLENLLGEHRSQASCGFCPAVEESLAGAETNEESLAAKSRIIDSVSIQNSCKLSVAFDRNQSKQSITMEQTSTACTKAAENVDPVQFLRLKTLGRNIDKERRWSSPPMVFSQPNLNEGLLDGRSSVSSEDLSPRLLPLFSVEFHKPEHVTDVLYF
ncbi:BTB/POZ domain-containing protein 8 [Patella vulgata]|uniref:BTB/POZ domain-containing protein 8 n=1 Tax=Patella vulgata TaxID=6465 RepID=UPI0021800B75|nr:BTB/POZ domain-containing protein 8 [Patella vulgata]